jgi:thiol-disulfide isomerase/thioredoxin
VVVNFWGSWCTPCRKDAPVLRRVADETYANGVRFVGVDIRDTPGAAQAFEKATRSRIRASTTRTASWRYGWAAWAPQATPSTYVVDRKGRIAAVFSGATAYDELHSAVAPMLENG